MTDMCDPALQLINGISPGNWELKDHGYTFIVNVPRNGYVTRDVKLPSYVARMDGSTCAAFEQKANAKAIAMIPEFAALYKAALALSKLWNARDSVDHTTKYGQADHLISEVLAEEKVTEALKLIEDKVANFNRVNKL